MTGTLILYPKEKSLILISGVDQEVVRELKNQCGCEHCTCQLHGERIDFGHIEYVDWREGSVHLEYGF